MPGRRLLACAALILVSVSAACGGDDDSGERRRRPPTTSATSVPTTSTTGTTLPAVMDLRPDGLGPIRFGDDADPALAALLAVLGPPQSDSGFTTTVEGFANCPGDRVRAVRWQGLTVLMARGSTDLRADGQPHVIAFQYGPKDTQPVLRTPEGVGLGSTAEDLRRAYAAQVEIVADDPFQKPEFRLGVAPRRLVGVLSAPDGKVELIDGGALCGEL